MKLTSIFAIGFLLVFNAGSAFAGGAVVEQGRIEAGAGQQFGNDSTGGFIVGDVNGSYKAEDCQDAWGSTEGSVLLNGKSEAGENIVKSAAFGKVESSAKANGKQFSEVAVKGEVIQGNWTTLTNEDNFVSAGNKTGADYLGARNGRYFTGAEGSATAGGESFSYLKVTPEETKASSGTSGFSSGVLEMRGGDPSANGVGQSLVGISVVNGGTSGSAYAEGNSNYVAQGPNAANGSLRSATEGNIKMLPDGISVTIGASSSSKANSR